MIITSPGFYNSKAGKCEVKDCNGRYAIGWVGDLPVVWNVYGRAQGCDFENGEFDITGPWVEEAE